MFPGEQQAACTSGNMCCTSPVQTVPPGTSGKLVSTKTTGTFSIPLSWAFNGLSYHRQPPISTRAAWERWRNSNYPSKVKKTKNKILAWTESDVASIWCSQSRLDGERPPLWSGVSTVSKYGMTTAQNRESQSIFSSFHLWACFSSVILWFYT